MTTYNVLTTIVAGGLAEQPEQARLDSARAKGYSVAQLGPGSAHPLEEELLETWLLLEVRVSGLGSRVSAQHAEEEPLETWALLQVGCWSAPCAVSSVDGAVACPWRIGLLPSTWWHPTPTPQYCAQPRQPSLQGLPVHVGGCLRPLV